MDSFQHIEEDYPGYTSIQQNIIDLLDPAEMEYYLQDKSLAPLRKVPVCIAASVYRMSAGNCMPSDTGNNKQEDQKLLSFNAYQRNESPWESYRQRRTKKAEDSSSCSTLESTCSSRSDSPEPKHHRHHSSKKRSNHMLLREIRRLRGENAFLRTSVSVLKNDLRDVTLSRQDTDVIHKRTYDEFESRYSKLEQEYLYGKDEIKELKEQIEQLQLAANSHQHSRTSSQNDNNSLTLHDAAFFKRKHSNVFGCYEFEEDDESMSCQPVAHESALPEVEVKMDELKTTDEQIVNDYFSKRAADDLEMGESSSTQDDEEEEDEEEEEELEPFEQVAASYIHQAILSKLSSARVRLEFDDLILKYEPTSDTITAVLADAFVNWICSLLTKLVDKSSTATKIFTSQIQTGIVEFWESILQCYTVEDECQVQLLNHIESEVNQVKKSGCSSIVDHFDRLILMLYKYHVVDDEAVVAWWQNPLDNDISRKIRAITTRFVEWVQDEDDDDEDDDDEECDNDDEECGNDDEVEDEDDNDYNEYEEDDDTGFDFMESPIPEEDEEDNLEFAHDDGSDNDIVLNNQPINNNIEDLLTIKERDPCVCQFNYDNDTSISPSLPPSPTSSNNKHELAECSCDTSTYTTPPATEKKKKSVRIAM